MLQKRVLSLLISQELLNTRADLESIAESLHSKRPSIAKSCGTLKKLGLVSLDKNGQIRATEKGRSHITVVFTGGTYDIIHPGHIHTLKSSKGLGDVLAVSIARDETVLKNKGHYPTNNERERAKMIGAIRYVDAALLGSEGDIFEILKRVRPQVITLGYDQKHDEANIDKELKRRGLRSRIVRLDSPVPDIKSSSLLKSGAIVD
ncbi:MAG: adenylyltransferase/cytidyltransferase family protein [Nitrososphaerales archaeon]